MINMEERKEVNLMSYVKKFVMHNKRAAKKHPHHKKHVSPTPKSEGKFIKFWNKLRGRAYIPSYALESMQSLHDFAMQYEEKFSESESPEDREAKRLFSAVKQRAFSEKFFNAAVKTEAVSGKVFVKKYKKVNSKFAANQQRVGSHFKKAINVSEYVRGKPKKWTLKEKFEIAKMKLEGMKLSSIYEKNPHRSYLSIATKLTRIKQKYGSLQSFVNEIRNEISEGAKGMKIDNS